MKRNFTFCSALGLTSLLASLCGGHSRLEASDWPQWRGPQRNGISAEKGLLQAWPKDGPKLWWRIEHAGSGYATPSVVGERFYLLANEGPDHEFVQAHSVQDGSRIWRTPLGKVGTNVAEMNFAAARSTPTVDGPRLYALGSDGDLACLELSTGKPVWQKNLRQEFGGRPGAWAYAESPLVDGNAVVCTPGGAEATLVALDKQTGRVLWKCAAPEKDLAAFASAVVTEAGGVRQYVQLLEKGLIGVEATTGKILWRFGKATSRYGANIPTPLAADGAVYVGSAGTGGGLVRLKGEAGGIQAEPVYFEAKLPTAIGGVVKVGNTLYGTTGQALLALDFATGKLHWEERALGTASLLYAEGRLYLHAESGEVGLAEVSPDQYVEKGRFTPPNRPEHSKQMEMAWAYPVVANGRLYLRDHGVMWCYDVRAK